MGENWNCIVNMAFLIVQKINIWRDKPFWDSLFHHFPLITFLCSSEVCMLPPPFHPTPDAVCGWRPISWQIPLYAHRYCFQTRFIFFPRSALLQIRLIWPGIKSWRASATWSVVVFSILHLKNRPEEWGITYINTPKSSRKEDILSLVPFKISPPGDFDHIFLFSQPLKYLLIYTHKYIHNHNHIETSS